MEYFAWCNLDTISVNICSSFQIGTEHSSFPQYSLHYFAVDVNISFILLSS